MGNSILETIKSANINCCNQNLKKAPTFKLEEDENKFNFLVIDLNKQKSKEENIYIESNLLGKSSSKNGQMQVQNGSNRDENYLLHISSLNNVQIQVQNGSYRDYERENDRELSSTLNLNQQILEEYNINIMNENIGDDNKYSYNYFFSKILDVINKLRIDPLAYSKLLSNYSNVLIEVKYNKSYLLSNEEKIYFEFNKNDFIESENASKKWMKN